MHLPSKLTMYRGVTMLASLAAPVLLGFVLNWQQQVGRDVKALSIQTASLNASFVTLERELRERVRNVEQGQRERVLASYTTSDAQRDRDIVDERMDLHMELVQKNAANIEELRETMERMCDSIEGCDG
jgi:hypothetical protein